MNEGAKKRGRFDAVVTGLVGRTIESVIYRDLAAVYGQPRRWDYGEWHHAVMGVEFGTDRGPVSLTWTDTFWPYGIEAIPRPLSQLIHVAGEHWDVSSAPPWNTLLRSPIRSASTYWETFTIEGAGSNRPSVLDMPLGIQLDFDAGTAWAIAAIPQEPDMREVSVPGDEIVVVFTGDRLRQFGFPREFGDPTKDS